MTQRLIIANPPDGGPYTLRVRRSDGNVNTVLAPGAVTEVMLWGNVSLEVTEEPQDVPGPEPVPAPAPDPAPDPAPEAAAAEPPTADTGSVPPRR